MHIVHRLAVIVRRLAVVELCLFLLLALAATWPLPLRMVNAIPLGTEKVATVPLLNVWVVWWNADRARHLYRGYWDAPIFYPERQTFAYSEAHPLTVITAPLLWLTGSRVAAYNVYLLLMLALNGWSAYHLVRRVELDWLPAFFGGVLVLVLPFVHWRLGVLQLVPLGGILWTIHALYGFGARPTLLRGAAVGLAFAVTYLLCNYYGLFFSVLLILSGAWLLGRQAWQWRSYVRLLPAAALALVLVYPIVRVQRQAVQRGPWQRPQQLIERLSAELGDYTTSPNSKLPLPDPAQQDRRQRWPLGPGYATWGLAAIGAAYGLVNRKQRRWTLFCLVLLAAAVGLSLGPKLEVASWSPYRWLIHHYPGFAYVRSPYRFAVFAQLAACLLAAMALQFGAGLGVRLTDFRSMGPRPVAFTGRGPMLRWLRPEGGVRKVHRALITVVLVVVGVLAAGASWPGRIRLFTVPAVDEQREWITWLDEYAPADAAVVCVPFVQGVMPSDFFETTLWMYWGTFHRRPLTGGYSGYFPDSFFEMKSAMANFPDARSIRLLQQKGVRYCVARSSGFAEPLRTQTDQLHQVVHDARAGIEIYEIKEARQPSDDLQ